MKIKNTLPFHDRFLRRAVSWVAKQIALPVRSIKEARFGFVRKGCIYSGRFYPHLGKISVRIDQASSYPYKGTKRGPTGAMEYELIDQLDTLVFIIAHEAWHAKQHKERLTRRRSVYEANARKASIEVLEQFKARKNEIIQEWSVGLEAEHNPPKTTRRDRNKALHQKLKRDKQHLERWERKLKLAMNKVQCYRNRLKMLEKQIATRSKATDTPSETSPS